jgi:hypothetical protein
MTSRYSVEARQQIEKLPLFTLVGVGKAPGVDGAVGVDNEPELQCITVAENDCAQTESADRTGRPGRALQRVCPRCTRVWSGRERWRRSGSR